MVFCYCLFVAFFLISAFRRMGDCKGRTIRKLMGGGGAGVDPAQLLLRYINQAELPFLICERTEALSVMVFVLEQQLSTIVWTPIQYVTVYFRDVPGAALLRHRNRAEITLLMYEQKAYPWI